MATELNYETLPLEMERLQTSIKYHDWFLGFVVVVGISLSIYLVRSMNSLEEGLFEVRTQIMLMQKDIATMKSDIETMELKIDTLELKVDSLELKIDTLDKKMDRYHGGAGPG